MSNAIIIYEDEGYKNFLPLTWTRPVYDLRCGINTFAEKIARCYPKAKIEHSCRYYLPGQKTMRFEKGLFINGRLLAYSRLAKEISLKGPDEIFYSGDEIVAVRAVSRDFAEVRKKAKIKRIQARVLKYPWELITLLGGQLRQDSRFWNKKKKRKTKIDRSVVIYNAADVFIEDGVEIEANCVLDARHGPIYIGKNSIIRPLTYLKGPLSIGPVCRLGGEVGESIFHGYTNKQHYGFIGHAYICEWVNLGAGTTNSDLKNNYGPVKVTINGKQVDSGEKFVGCFIGDHAKTGIGTLITTGCVIGVGANVFSGGVTPKVVSSFSWNIKDKYKLDKFIAVTKTVMSRRKIKCQPIVETLLRKVYQLTR